MKVAFKLPKSKITWMIIILVALFLGYLVYKGVFIYKEGVESKDMCKVPKCSNAGKNCNNAIQSGYKCTGSKNKCKKSSEKYTGDNTSLQDCKND